MGYDNLSNLFLRSRLNVCNGFLNFQLVLVIESWSSLVEDEQFWPLDEGPCYG